MTEFSWAIAGIVVGLIVLLAGGELLVRGASRLASAMRISPLVIGLTVVAFGTSSPELVVALQSAIAGNSEIAVGNVVGSNIFNVLFILGFAALIVPLVVSSTLIRRDVPLMIVASLSVFVLGWDNRIGRIDGFMLFFGLMTYTWYCIRQSRRETETVRNEFAKLDSQAEFSKASRVIQVCLIFCGLVLLGFGSKWLVDGAVTIATQLGVSQMVIGLTIVAAGTSLPEVVTSIVAAIRGEREIAVGNIVGSNLFNILGVLGLSSIIAPGGIGISSAALHFDIPLMIAVAIACLPIFFTGHEISRWEGAVFVFYYFAYTTFLILDATGNEFTRTFGKMVLFVIPLTVITLVVTSYRGLRSPRRPDATGTAAKEPPATDL